MRRFSYSLLSLAVITSFAQAQDKPTQKDEHDIETLVITATPLNRSVLESATPVSIVAGEELKQRLAPTLGETLKNLPGVHSTYFGPVSSSPIIRGLDGPRIKVVQNGLDVSDASRVGPDHIVSTEAATATQIEVLRGPATLLYGSGAIGGVVNIVDNRLPRVTREGVEGEVSYLHDSVSSEDTFSVNLDGGAGQFAWHFDAFDRKTGNFDIPGPAEVGGDEDTGELDNSFIDANGYTGGIGWVGDDMRAAFSYGNIESEYGIPGHAHEEEHEDEEEHDEEGHGEEEIFGRLKQERYQGMIDWLNIDGFLTELHLHTAFTDYDHAEIEEGEVGTVFENETLETRLWAKHKKIAGWEGVLGVNHVDVDFSALGEEAFSPATETETTAIFLLEEKRSGNFLWQLGARLEDTEIAPDNRFFEHDEDHEEEAHEEEHEDINFSSQSYTSVSLSAGVVWTMSEDSSFAFNFAHSERAPTSAEIFSNGLHIATGTFEVGAGLEIEQEGDEIEFVQSSSSVREEVSNNLDLTYRYSGDHVEASFSVFFNQIDDYLYQQSTGLFFEDDHGHEDEHEDEMHEGEEHEGEEEGLPIFLFSQQGADIYGFEAEIDWHINDNLRLDTYADLTRAELSDGSNVPRIPPMRIGAELHWEADNWHAELGATYYAKQDDIANFETETDSYTLLNASLNYYTSLGDAEWVLFVKGKNLSDKLARVHSSFIKDEAPLPGRSIIIGTRISF